MCRLDACSTLSNGSPVSSLFSGTLRRFQNCLNCKIPMTEFKLDELHYLTVHSSLPSTTMEDYIQRYAREVLDEQNKIYCPNCASKQVFELTCKYKSLPEVSYCKD
jgi:ubiquitin C-terminal hydrolase